MSSLDTPHGEVRVAWRAEAGELAEVDVTVPTGCAAAVRWPDGWTTQLDPGRHVCPARPRDV